MRRRRAEDGFASVAAAGLVALVLLVTAVSAGAVAVAAARHRVEGVADLAALAAARRAIVGEAAACEAAAQVARRNAARVVSCRLDGLDALVEVERPLPGRLAGLGSARAWARAGRG